jgi:protein transport protein SEC23
MAVPVSCMYTPLKAVTGLATVQYPPIHCQNKAQECGAVLNPYCRVDFNNKIWICPFCLTRNHFPTHYADISTENRPAEIIPQYTTMGKAALTHVPSNSPLTRVWWSLWLQSTLSMPNRPARLCSCSCSTRV